MAVNENLQYLNRLINCIDIGKDAKVPFDLNGHKTALTNPVHGTFLRDDMIFPLFNGNNLTTKDQDIIKGVGDEKDVLKAKIDASIKLKDLEKQQIVRLKFSPNHDSRLEDMFLSPDAGPGPENFCKDYTLILTPASVMDSAKKPKTHTKQINMLSKPYALNDYIIEELDLQRAVSMEFTSGKDYTLHFEIPLLRGELRKNSISFNKNTYKEIGTDYCGGNPIKNKYIYENYTDPSKQNEIRFRIVMKELGDTLQVACLKDIILKGEYGLTADKTAICTNDTGVWLRSIVNGVSCIFTHEGVSTFYPVAGNEAQKTAADALIKKQLADKMNTNNMEVIHILKDFQKYLWHDKAFFHEKPILENNKALMTEILKTVTDAMTIVYNNLKKQLRLIQDVNSYRDFVAKSMFSAPFRVKVKGTKIDIQHIQSFKYFLKEIKMYEFNAPFVYQLLYFNKYKENIIGKDIRDIVPSFTVGSAPNASPRRSASPEALNMEGGSHGKDDFQAMIRLNGNQPGFVAYYTLMYLPEIIYIAYSILYVYKISDKDLQNCATLFKSENIRNLLDSFGKCNKDNIFDYSPRQPAESLKEADNFIVNLYKILTYFKHTYKGHSIFDYCYDEINWMLEFFTPDSLNIEITELQESKVMDIYQDLYDADAYLTTLNMREERSPVEFISEVPQSASTKKTAKPANRISIRKSLASARSGSMKRSAKALKSASTKRKNLKRSKTASRSLKNQMSLYESPRNMSKLETIQESPNPNALMVTPNKA